MKPPKTPNIKPSIYMFLIRDEKEERKKQARSNKQTNRTKQHSTPKAVTFPRKNELPRVGLEPTTLYTLDRALYQLCYQSSCQGSTAVKAAQLAGPKSHIMSIIIYG